MQTVKIMLDYLQGPIWTSDVETGTPQTGIAVIDENEEIRQLNFKIQDLFDGYYEFNINHNSEYLMTNKKLDDSLLTVVSDDNVVGFQLSKKSQLLLISVGVIVVIAIGVVLAITNKKKNKVEENTNKDEFKNIK